MVGAGDVNNQPNNNKHNDRAFNFQVCLLIPFTE